MMIFFYFILFVIKLLQEFFVFWLKNKWFFGFLVNFMFCLFVLWICLFSHSNVYPQIFSSLSFRVFWSFFGVRLILILNFFCFLLKYTGKPETSFEKWMFHFHFISLLCFLWFYIMWMENKEKSISLMENRIEMKLKFVFFILILISKTYDMIDARKQNSFLFFLLIYFC